MQKKIFISKVFQMSFAMFFLNISNVCYSIFMSKKAGAEGIGMFHLVMSVYSLLQVIAISGIGLTATRLLSDMPLSMARSCADGIVVKCIRVCLVPAVLAGTCLFLFSDIISEKILFDNRCSLCLKILSPTLICVATSSVINGYFTAFGMIRSLSFGRLLSDGAVWIVTLYLLNKFPKSQTYIPVVIGFSSGLVVQTMSDYTIWRKSRTNLYCHSSTDYKSIIRLCTPIALGSYLRTGLTGAENVLIPAMLSIFGTINPVASYGIIKGMTMPILMFPMVFISAFTSLIVPEIARRRSQGYKNGIRYISSLSVQYILRFAIFISAVFLKWNYGIVHTFFDESDASLYLKLLSFLPIFLFLDSVVDSLLKGMDEQVATLKINVADSFCRVILTAVLIPRFGMVSYIVIMYMSEIVNLFFSYLKLKKVTDLSFPFKNGILTPLVSAFVGEVLLRFAPPLGIWGDICFFACLYIVLLSFISKIFRPDNE